MRDCEGRSRTIALHKKSDDCGVPGVYASICEKMKVGRVALFARVEHG